MSGVIIGIVIGALALWPDPEIFGTDDAFFVVAVFGMIVGAVHGVVLGAVYGAIISVVAGALVKTSVGLIHQLTSRGKLIIGVSTGAFVGAMVVINLGEMITLLYGVYGSAIIGALMGIPVGVIIAIISIPQKKS